MSRLPKESFPLLTVFIILVCVVLFLVEALVQYKVGNAFHLSISPQVLGRLGGATKSGILERGEWHRLFAASWLHVDAMHLFFNMMALYLVGEFLEPFVEKGWFLTIYLFSALAGVFLSIVFLPESIVSVGASGGVMGLLTAGTILTAKIQQPKLKREIFQRLLMPLVVTLIPLLIVFINWILGKPSHSDGIDHAGHIGGALAGVVLGYNVLKVWPSFEPQPRFQMYAAMVGLVLLLCSFLAVGEGLFNTFV